MRREANWPCRSCGKRFVSEKAWMRHERNCTVQIATPAGAAELASRITQRLKAEAERMEEECSHPPCVHAQGVRLAADWATAEFCDLVNEAAHSPVLPDPTNEDELRDQCMQALKAAAHNPLCREVER